MSLLDGSSLSDGISVTPVTAAIIGAGAGVVAGGVAGYALGASGKKRKKSSRKSSRKRTSSRRTRRRSKQRRPYTAGKGKDRSRKRIRYTKNNQPYVIMANGRARFIKKSSVRNSRRRKGGRY